MSKPKDDGGITDTLTAYYHACHDYPGSITAMAAMLRISYDVLRKKLSPHYPEHKLQEREAMQILGITRDTRILDSICNEVDACWFVPGDIPPQPSDMDVLKTSTGMMDRTLRAIDEFHSALEDGDITAEERARLDQCLMELQQQIHRFNDTAKKFEREPRA